MIHRSRLVVLALPLLLVTHAARSQQPARVAATTRPAATRQAPTPNVLQTSARPCGAAITTPAAATPPPAPLVGGTNDACADAIEIAGVGQFSFDNTNATQDGADAAICYSFGTSTIDRDVWFLWTAPADGDYTVRTCGLTAVDTKIAVYDGEDCATSLAVDCSEDICGLQSEVDLLGAVGGGRHLIRIGVFPGVLGGTGMFEVVDRVPPIGNGGGDDCLLNPEPIAGQGIFAFSNNGAGTGFEGQNELFCGSIPNDVWFIWTSDADGFATLKNCGRTTLNTKLAVYPGGGCPVDGTSLVCRDDSCDEFRETVTFEVVAGGVYTIQIGSSPSSLGAGSGSFEITIDPPPDPPPAGVYQYDDGDGDVCIGFGPGTDSAICWMHVFEVGGGGSDEIVEIQAAWGCAAGLDGEVGSLHIWDDPNNDGDPSDGVLLYTQNVTITNAGTDLLNTYVVDPPVTVTGSFMVGALAVDDAPARRDSDQISAGRAWIAGNFGSSTLDVNDLTNNSFPVADLDSQGLSGIWRLRARGSTCGLFGSPVAIPVGAGPVSAEVGDPDADARLDLVVTHSTARVIHARWGDGSGQTEAITIVGDLPSVGATTEPRASAQADMNHDGFPDIVYVASGPACGDATIGVLVNGGARDFTNVPGPAVGPGAADLVVVDLDNDGHLDVVTSNAAADGTACPDDDLSILMGDGLGGFAPAVHLPVVGLTPRGLDADDVNEDGNADLVVATSASVLVLLGDGLGGLVPAAPIPTGAVVSDVVLGDVSGDGLIDLVATLESADLVGVLLGDGLGGFGSPTIEGVGSQPGHLILVDADVDGNLDVMTSNPGSDDLSTLLGDGLGGFRFCFPAPVGLDPAGFSAADADNDGDPEVAVAEQSAGTFSILAGSRDPLPGLIQGLRYPAGTTSFADSVHPANDPGFGGGPVPLPPFDDASAALGVPDSLGVVGTRTASTGAGGRLAVGFEDNRLTNSGDARDDLVLYPVGDPVELATVRVRPASPGTIDALAGIGVFLDVDGFVDVGQLNPADDRFDLDAVFPGFAADELRFDAVLIEDDPLANSAGGASSGPDLDAVGAFSSDEPFVDLAVSDLIAPVQGLEGQNFQFSFDVTNLGDQTPGSGHVDRVWLSTDPFIGGGDQLLLEVSSPTLLAPGETYTRVATRQYPFTPGFFWLIAQTDAYDTFDEGVFNESNNVRASVQSLEIVEIPKPDLMVDVLSLPGTSIDSGSPVTVTFEVTNVGTGATDAPFWNDRVYLTPTVTIDGSIPSNSIDLGTLGNLAFLVPGESYVHPATLNLPTDFSGPFWVAVVGDVSFALGLDPDRVNNVAFSSTQLDVTLEPQPDLQVVSVAPEFNSAFSGRPVRIDWTTENFGIGLTDTGGWGEAMYLSTNNDDTTVFGDLFLGVASANGFLAAGEQAPFTASPTLPVDLQGDYWIKIRSDSGNQVSECDPVTGDCFSGTAATELNNIGVSTSQLSVILSITPDLRPDSVSVPASALIGHQLSAGWSVVDDSSANWTSGFSWTDCLYLSEDAVLDTQVDRLLGCRSQSASPDGGGGWVGTDYSKSLSATFPTDLSPGTYHVIAVVDSGDSVFEFEAGAGNPAEQNNVLVSAPFTADLIPADLQIAVGAGGDLPPVSAAPGQEIQLPFTVSNTGPGGTPVSVWSDRVYLSTDTVLDGSDPLIRSVTRTMPLASGAQYSATPTGDVPTVAAGSYHLIFATDRGNSVFEPGGEGNNQASVPFTVTGEVADLVATSFLIPDLGTGGDPISLEWTVENQGTSATLIGYWTDRVWLSEDNVVDGGDQLVGSVGHAGVLAAGDDYSVCTSFVLPLTAGGLQFLIVEADTFGQVFESNETNNERLGRLQSDPNGGRVPIDVEPGPLANLTIEAVDAVSAGVAGQPLQVSWTVRNDGIGPTDRNDWRDWVYLSEDQFLDPGLDLLIGTYRHPDFLDVGEQRLVVEDFQLPSGLAGNFFAIVKVDGQGLVTEGGITGDNVDSDPNLTTITLPLPSDLRVTDVQVPTSVELGGPLSASWTTTNEGANPATGQWFDRLYLSLDTTLDATDVLVGTVASTAGAIGVPGSHVESTAGNPPAVPGALPGLYHLLVRTDANNQIPESQETDNVGASAALIDVQALQINAGDSVVRELRNGDVLYVEMSAAAGETIEIFLDHDDSDAWTELYVREGAPPTPGLFDFAFTSPGSNLQQVLIPSTTGASYFILARATANVGAAFTDATLSTTIVPFAVNEVEPTEAGRDVVTFEVFGSQMDDVVAARLERVGTGETILPLELLAPDASLLLAAFDLDGALGGSWRLVAVASDATESAFEPIAVQPAVPLAVGARISIAPSIRKGRIGAANATITNEGNVNVNRAVVVIATRSNEGVTLPDERVDLSATQLGLDEFETDGDQESLVLLVDDLGPSQEADFRIEAQVGDSYEAEHLVLGMAARPFDPTGNQGAFLPDLIEALRQAVIADPATNGDLLARALDPPMWSSAVLTGLGPDGTDVFPSGSPPTSGRAFVQALATAAAAGLPTGNEVPGTSVDVVSGILPCVVFSGQPIACGDLSPASCGNGQAIQTVVGVDGANVPVSVVCAQTPTSDDPNEKTAPGGFGASAVVSSDDELCYRIYFENQESAGAPAANVFVCDELDLNFKLSTVGLTQIQFGDTNIPIPGMPLTWQGTVDLSDSEGVIVKIFAGVNAATREVFWNMESIDPLTGEPPVGPQGFLPPNNADGDGEGFVEFAVLGDPGLVMTGSTVQNRAAIVFDVNVPLETMPVANSFDADSPTSNMTVILNVDFTSDLLLQWSGDDVGTGVASYTIYASEDGGPFAPILVDTTETSTVFTSVQGRTYAFYSRARDNTGNLEPEPGTPDAVISIPNDCNDNGVEDSIDIADDTSSDCNGSGVPDECELVDNDCDSNGVPDECDPDCDASGTPDACETFADCNSSGIPDECELAGNDCDSNGVPDECDPDCDASGTPDACEAFADCNSSGIPDSCELVDNDCDSNGVPDECDPDCDASGTPDACEVFADCNSSGIPDSCELVGNDCDSNGVPDECDPDCDASGTPDACEAFADCNSSGIPDSCELVGNDCDSNGVPDECDPDCDASGTPDACEVFADCNSSGIPDSCELVGNDCDSNGVPDECDPDCDASGTPDACEAFADCNSSGIPDSCELVGNDCDSNGVPDECDPDCDASGTPDACEAFADCNSSGIPDSCELVGNDCDSNGVPDECDPDCDSSGTPDACEAFADCNSSGIPDSCELVGNDCDANGVPDECDPDCDTDGVPDACAIAAGAVDFDGNGVPDTCECEPIRYCSPAQVNSTGFAAQIDWSGSTSLLADDLVLTAGPMPRNHSVLFIYSPDTASTAFGDGVLCVGNGSMGFVARLPAGVTDDLGTFTHPVDLRNPPAPAARITAGSTWYFQGWFRDTLQPGGAGFNFSDALSITFCP